MNEKYFRELEIANDEIAPGAPARQSRRAEVVELLEYWESPLSGATGDDAVSDGHAPEHRAAAIALIRAGGPWDEEILGPRPPEQGATWPPIPE